MRKFYDAVVVDWRVLDLLQRWPLGGQITIAADASLSIRRSLCRQQKIHQLSECPEVIGATLRI